jgi:pimeloyl-ACP methyl ester carboxylesterase
VSTPVPFTQDRIALPSGLTLAIREWRGPGPLALLHHGTGFCAATWRRVAERLAARFHVVAFDARGHGASDKPAEAFRWATFVDDARDLARALVTRAGASSVALGVGHSFGGAVLLRLAQCEPELLRSVVAIDPVLLTQERYAARGLRADGSHALSIATRMRQARFASRAAARDALSSLRIYATWEPAVLDDYLDGGLTDAGDGAVRLECAPETEARMFELGPNRALFEGDPIRVPALVQRARHGWFTAEEYAQFRPAFPSAELEEIDAGHLVPMEEPDVVAARVLAFASQRAAG